MTAVLVTGAAGFIGSHLAHACHRAGWSVTALDHRNTLTAMFAGTGIEILQMSAIDKSVLARVRRGQFDAVLHHAAISDTLEERWNLLQENNIQVPLTLADACAESGTRFIYASSSSVYGRITRRIPVSERSVDDRELCSGPLNLYAQSKLALDRSMTSRGSALPWVGLRYTNVFGSGEEHKGQMASIIFQMLRASARGERIDLFSDTLLAARDYLPVEALVDTVVRLARTDVPADVYNLGAGHAVSFATLLQWCAEFRSDGVIDLRLTPNPIRTKYQYWTCADTRALGRALPGVQHVPLPQVRAAAAALNDDLTNSAMTVAIRRQPIDVSAHQPRPGGSLA